MRNFVFQKIELHNHSTESDGLMNVEELLTYLESSNITTFALTDHNTISGNEKIHKLLQEKSLPLEFVDGYELTSYYGHILCFCVKNYIPWTDIALNHADLLFHRAHAQDALVGIAHPYSMPSPLSNGMRFVMKVNDWNHVDFLEIINNAHPMNPDNQQAIQFWEKLYLEGYAIAPTSGLDLHKPQTLSDKFTTWLLYPAAYEQDSIEAKLKYCIQNQSLCISKNCAFSAVIAKGKLYLTLKQHHLFQYYAKLITKNGTESFSFFIDSEQFSLSFPFLSSFTAKDRCVLELYENEEMSYDTICAILPVIGDGK